MNDTVLKELKTVVEQAVQPVRATLARKRMIREELLAHLVSVFEEEAERLGDEQAALEHAKRRFGDTGDLTTQLQQAVPRWDRCRSILENMGCRPNESAWHLAAKHFVVMLLFYSAPFIVLTLGYQRSLTIEAQREFMPALVLGLPLIALLNVFLSVVVASLLDKIGPALAAKRWGRILLAVLCGLVVCGLALPPVAGAAVLFVLMARQAVKEWRYEAGWA